MIVSEDLFNICLYDIHRLQKRNDIKKHILPIDCDTINKENIYTNLLSIFLYRVAADPGFFASLLPDLIDNQNLIDKTKRHISNLKTIWTESTTDNCFNNIYGKSDDGDILERAYASLIRRYEYSPASLLYPARQKMNPAFIQKCISEVNPYDYKERKELETYLSERIHAFTIQEDVPYFVLPQTTGEEFKYYQKWVSFRRENIFFGLKNYDKLDPLHDDSYSALQNAEYIDEQCIRNTDDKAFVEKITDNPLIYFSPLATELRKKFHTGQYDVILSDYDITKKSNAENVRKEYIQYFKYTTDTITILLEFWFNEEYTNNQTALIKRLNTETKIDTVDAWNKVKDMYSVSMQEDIIAAKLQKSFSTEAELVYTSLLERDDLTELNKFISNFMLARVIANQNNSKRNLKRAMIYCKAAKKSLEIIRNKPDLSTGLSDVNTSVDNNLKDAFEQLSGLFEGFFNILSGLIDKGKSEGGKRLIKHSRYLNSQVKSTQNSKNMCSIDDGRRQYYSSFQISQTISHDSEIKECVNQLLPTINQKTIVPVDGQQIWKDGLELAIKPLHQASLIHGYLDLEDYDNAEIISSEPIQKLLLFSKLKGVSICPGIINILKKNVDKGRKELLSFLETMIKDNHINKPKQIDWIAFVFDQVITYIYPMKDDFKNLCNSICNDLHNLLKKHYSADEDKIIISEIYKGYVWYPGALKWFENMPEKKMSDETKERILLFKAQLYKWIYPRESIKIYQKISKSKYLNEDEKSDILSWMRTSFCELHDYIRVMKINQMDNVAPEYENLCLEQLEKELSVESVQASSLAKEHWKKAVVESLPILGIKNKDNEVNCSEAYRSFAVGLEQYLYSTVGKEIVAKLRKVKKSRSKIKLPKGWRSVVFGNDEQTIFLGTWEHVSDDLRKNDFSVLRKIIEETVDKDKLTLISDCAAMLHVKRNITSHGWFVMKSVAEFENEYKQIINKFNQLLMVFEKLEIED